MDRHCAAQAQLRIIQGITLIELMIVMFIIALTSASLGFNGYDYYRNIQLSETSRRLMTFLMHLQLEAQWFNRNYQLVHVKEDKFSGLDVWDSTDQRLVERFQFRTTTVQLVDIIGDENSAIIFYGQRNMASAGHMILKNAAGESKIIISSLGRIRVCQPPNGNHTLVVGALSC